MYHVHFIVMPLDHALIAGRHVVRGACPHDCPDTCALLTTVENGRAIAIRGAPDHPATGGVLCTKGRALPRSYLFGPARAVSDAAASAAKGEGRFARIAWDEALATIAARFSRHCRVGATDRRQFVPYSYAGTMGLLQYASMDRRFFHRLGASLLDRTICASAGKAGWAAAIGASVGMDVEQFENSRLIVIWGSNPVTSNLHFWTRAQEAKRRGAKLIAIDPYRSATAEKCHEHIALLPGTDGALALGLMHVLIADGPARPRLHRPLHRWASRELAARAARGRRSASRKPAASPPRRSTEPRARLRHDQAGRHSRQLRHAARARAAAMPCARSPACRRWSAPGAIRPAARCCRRRAPTRSTTRRSSGPT